MEKLRRFMENPCRFLVSSLYFIPPVLAVLFFVGALFAEPIEDDPTGEAGLSAAFIALCVAGIVMMKIRGKRRRLSKLMLGIGALASAYLWVAGESGIHPKNPELLASISILLIIGAIVAIGIPVVALLVERASSDR